MDNKRKRVDHTTEQPTKKQKVNHIETTPYALRWQKLEQLRKIYLEPITNEQEKIWVNLYKPVADSKSHKRYQHGPMRKCRNLLKKLMADEKARPFLVPVNAAFAPDYYFIIKRPICFDVISKNMEKKKYSRVEQFRDDVKRIFQNCYRYNLPGSEYRRMSDHLEREFDKVYKFIQIESDAIRQNIEYSFQRPKLTPALLPSKKPQLKKKKSGKGGSRKRKKSGKKRSRPKVVRRKKKKKRLPPPESDNFILDEEEDIWDHEIREDPPLPIAKFPPPPIYPIAAPLVPRRGKRNKKKKGAMDDFIVDEDFDDYEYFVEKPVALAPKPKKKVPAARKKRAPIKRAAAPRKRKVNSSVNNGAVPGSTITDSQKKNLTRIIPSLGEGQKNEILRMVQEASSTTEEEDDGSITLDLNKINGATLKKIYEYCKKCAKDDGSSSSDDSSESSDDSSDSSSDED